MRELIFLLKVSRPRFWFYTFGPYIVGLVAGVGNSNELIRIDVLAFGLYFLIPANVLIYGINDLFDYDTDRLNVKKLGYETLVTPDRRRMLVTAILATSIPFLVALLLVGSASVVFASGFLFFSIFYSAPPIRAKTKPFLDSAFNILYVMPGLFAYALVSGEFPPVPLIVAGALWTAAMHAYSAIPDIDADRQASIRTIATACGPYLTLVICSGLYLASAVLALEYLGFVAIVLGFAYLILMLASFRSVRVGTLFRLYRAFPVINVAAGFIIFWQIALNKLI